MERAQVIIHMYESIDGKIDGDWDGLPGDKASGTTMTTSSSRSATPTLMVPTQS